MGTRKTSFSFSLSATASSVPLIVGYTDAARFCTAFSSPLSSRAGAVPDSTCFTTGLRISSIRCGESSSTSMSGSARTSWSTATTDFSPLRIKPPARSPSVNATIFSLAEHRSLMESSILAPSMAMALS